MLLAGLSLAFPVLSASEDLCDPWPSCFGVCEWPDTPDLIGLRLSIPFATRQENLMGVDLGFWGEAGNVEGVMVNLLRNDVRETFGGLQVGIYNTVNHCECLSAQIGLVSEAYDFSGFQIGLVNLAGKIDGFQVGILNRAEKMYGFQIGLVNVIRRRSWAPILPVINMGF